MCAPGGVAWGLSPGPISHDTHRCRHNAYQLLDRDTGKQVDLSRYCATHLCQNQTAEKLCTRVLGTRGCRVEIRPLPYMVGVHKRGSRAISTQFPPRVGGRARMGTTYELPPTYWHSGLTVVVLFVKDVGPFIVL